MNERIKARSGPSMLARCAALAVSLLLATSLVPSAAWAFGAETRSEANLAASSAVSAQVSVSYQVADEFVLMPTETVEVSSDLAESYGYEDAVDASAAASALDALVYAHEELFGEEFTAENCGDYLVVSGGWVSLAFGEDASTLGFAINGEYPCDLSGDYGDWGYTGYSVAQAPLSSGDAVVFFYYEDLATWGDYLTSFSLDGEAVSVIELGVGEEATLQLAGFMYMMGSYNEADREAMGANAVVSGAQLASLDPETGEKTPIEGAVTDENGLATVSFAEAGTYYLSVICNEETSPAEIVVPWLEVRVADASAVSAAWPSYRGNDANNAVTAAATPTSAREAALAWSAQVGESWQDAPSAFIIADDALIVMSGTNIEKRDLATGELVASGEMAEAPSYGYAPPTYADGMVFAPLSNGTVQAFDVETLESLWVYRDAGGGQALSPIAYASGFVYLGFWNGEEAEANFVCIDAVDEDPSRGDEEKQAVWSFAHQGGFYGAGALVVGDVLVVGSDNGAAASDAEASASVFAIDAATGEILDEEAVAGDVRSSVVYSEEEGSVYLTTKAGMLYRFEIDTETGALERAGELSIGAQSTSTPVVYEGRVYAAAGADGFSSGSIAVVDASTLELVFEIAVDEGYPQCSLLLSTGSLQETGQIALYATYNNPPGGVLVVRMAPDCASADEASVEELYDPSAVNAAQYCVASVIAGDDGTLYYKNDSNRIFAIGTVEAVGAARAAQMSDLVLSDGEEHWVLSEGWIVTALGRGFVTGYVDPDTGVSTGLFGPDDAITRGQAATIIYRYANPASRDTIDPDSYASSSGRFSDLPETEYYNAAIEWCAEQGIVSGYDDPATGEPSGEFGPDDLVTREQLAKMLAELARVEGLSLDADESELSRFPDADESSSFAVGYLAWCAAHGVLTGDAQTGELNPTDTASRAEMVKMIVVTAGVIEASA